MENFILHVHVVTTSAQIIAFVYLIILVYTWFQ